MPAAASGGSGLRTAMAHEGRGALRPGPVEFDVVRPIESHASARRRPPPRFRSTRPVPLSVPKIHLPADRIFAGEKFFRGGLADQDHGRFVRLRRARRNRARRAAECRASSGSRARCCELMPSGRSRTGGGLPSDAGVGRTGIISAQRDAIAQAHRLHPGRALQFHLQTLDETRARRVVRIGARRHADRADPNIIRAEARLLLAQP